MITLCRWRSNTCEGHLVSKTNRIFPVKRKRAVITKMLMKMNLLICLIKEKLLRSNKLNLKLVDKKKPIEFLKINKSKKNFVMKITSLRNKRSMISQLVRLQMI